MVSLRKITLETTWRFMKPSRSNSYELYPRIIILIFQLEYPSMNLIANCDLGQSAKTDIWDYHMYSRPFINFISNFYCEYRYDSSSTFINSLHRWDTYDRTAPKVFNSEYAVTRYGNVGRVVSNMYAKTTLGMLALEMSWQQWEKQLG